LNEYQTIGSIYKLLVKLVWKSREKQLFFFNSIS